MPDGHIAAPLPAASLAERALAVAPAVPVPHAPAVERPALDRIGIGVSLTCAIHCVATALLGVVPAMAGGLPYLESIEVPLLVAALIVGTTSLVPAARAHRHRGPLGLFAAGMLVLLASRFVPEGAAEIALTVTGFTPVALAHLWNLRLCRH